MSDLLWISPAEALAVVISTVAIYLAMVLIVRVVGQRMLSAMSSFDLAAVIAFGAIVGRTALGDVPVLGSGLVALVIIQAGVGQFRLTTWGSRTVRTHPILLMAGPEVLSEEMRRCHVHPAELQSRLRLAGVRHPDEVAVVIFEPSGGISVLRRGRGLSPELLSGVAGAGSIPPEFFD